jgi:membrane peptidoglycan carboxypeptidase
VPGGHASPPSRLRIRRQSALPDQRSSRRVTRPVGVGWWQTPSRRRPAVLPSASATEEPARHRVPPSPPTPRAGRRHRAAPLDPEQLRARRQRRIRLSLFSAAGTVVFGPVVAFALGYLLFSVPTPDDAVNNQVALVSFADGTQLARLVPEQGNRIKVPIESVPGHVRQAVLAAEDRSFYSNPGFDVGGIMRAAWNQVRGGSGGGSTITQQYVKTTLVGDEPSLWRKYREVVVAVKISGQRTKDEILGDYLNAIYFGRGAYGIQSASQAYFGKNVQELNISEGAVLAGLIQSPSRWDPAVNPERAVQRWTFVLDGMAAQGWLSPTERDAAQFPPTVARKRASGGVPGDHRGHVVNAVTTELEELGISEQDIAQQGLRITTTIDPVRQEQAVAAAQEALEGQPDNLRASMVAIDPESGGVRAYYGGPNGLGLDYARVRRLAGSTFKPFVVLAGLLRDPPVGLGEVFDGRETSGLRNATGADCDRCDLKQAMTVSNNVVFNTLARRVGPQAVAEAARAAGITAPLDDPNSGIALGNKEVSAYELASAYATIAAGGLWRPPHLVTTVVTADGRVLYEARTEGERRFPERVARNVIEAMIDVARRDGLALPGGRPVAAKTGTVESRFDGENNDAWMAGFTPSLSTSVWVGTDMNAPIRTAGGDPISGKGVPGEVWQEFMGEALESEPVESFPQFEPIGEAPAPEPAGDEPPPVEVAETAPDPAAPGGPEAVGPDGAPVGPDGAPDPADDTSPSGDRDLLGTGIGRDPDPDAEPGTTGDEPSGEEAGAPAGRAPPTRTASDVPRG